MKYIRKNALLWTVCCMIVLCSGILQAHAEIRRSQSLLGPGIYSLYLGEPSSSKAFSLENTFHKMANELCRGNYAVSEQASTANQMIGIIECPSQTNPQFHVPEYGTAVNSAAVLRNDVLIESGTYSLYIGMPDVLTRISNLDSVFRQTVDEICQGQYTILEQASTANQMIGMIRCQTIEPRSYQPKEYKPQPQTYESPQPREIGHNIGLYTGGKLWYVTWTTGMGSREYETDSTFMWGPQISLDIGESFWLSGMFLTGDFTDKHDGITEKLEQGEAELVIGRIWRLFDFGTGIRYSYIKTSATLDGYDLELAVFEGGYVGPMLYLGSGNTFGESPLGWYVGASWMITDFVEDNYAEHYNIEGGVFISMNRLKGTLGYRYKDYYSIPDDNSITLKGFVASVGFYF